MKRTKAIAKSLKFDLFTNEGTRPAKDDHAIIEAVEDAYKNGGEDWLLAFIAESGDRSSRKGFHGDSRSPELFLRDVKHLSLSDQGLALSHFMSDQWNDGEKLALIHEEVSELLGEIRDVDQKGNIYYNPSKPEKPEGKAVEAADLFIRLCDWLSHREMGEDFVKALRIKSDYNETRPHKHGRKF